jgi:hypothetical protein
MVNHQDPVTIAAKYGACAFLPGLQRIQVARPISIRLFNSGTRQVLARREWHIYVSLSLTVSQCHLPGDT